MAETFSDNRYEGISIQTDLSGYSFIYPSGLASAGKVTFSGEYAVAEDAAGELVPSVKERISGIGYDSVSFYVHSPRHTLVPREFFRPEDMRESFSCLFPTGDAEILDYRVIPWLDAVMVYSFPNEYLSAVRSGLSSSEVLPSAMMQLESMRRVSGDAVSVDFRCGLLTLCVFSGGLLYLCCSYSASDSLTVLYHMLLAVQSCGLTPSDTDLYFFTGEDETDRSLVSKYFRVI